MYVCMNVYVYMYPNIYIAPLAFFSKPLVIIFKIHYFLSESTNHNAPLHNESTITHRCARNQRRFSVIIMLTLNTIQCYICHKTVI